MSSSGGIAMAFDRRRSAPIGIEQKALNTLEKFVELCDNSCPDKADVVCLFASALDRDRAEWDLDKPKKEEEPAEIGPKKVILAENVPKVVAASSSKASSTPTSTSTEPKTLVVTPQGQQAIQAQQKKPFALFRTNKSKQLPELYIDRTLATEFKLKGEVNTCKTVATIPKKSEELWVRRIADRSFRSFRGQQLPTIITENVDEGAELSSKALPVTMASSSTSKYSSKSKAEIDDDLRTRHRSGGDELIPTSKKTNTILDAFRPRSKSDVTRLKKPNFMSSMKNAVQNSLMGASSNENTDKVGHPSTLNPSSSTASSSASSSSHRPRSGSESLRSPVSKVMDIFRNRSASVNEAEKRNRTFNVILN